MTLLQLSSLVNYPQLDGSLPQANQRTRRTMIWLQGHGISAGLAAKMHEVYERDTIRVVQESPYRLIADIRGVGFKKADQIAREIGIARDAPSRVQAGV